jgi:hypothetical protein
MEEGDEGEEGCIKEVQSFIERFTNLLILNFLHLN